MTSLQSTLWPSYVLYVMYQSSLDHTSVIYTSQTMEL